MEGEEETPPLFSMTDRWIEYDPNTGIKETNIVQDDGTLIVRKEADVQELVDATKAIANSGATDIGIKKGLWHYCSIPLAVQYEMLVKHGVNIQDRNHWPKVFDLVNQHYPYLKTTHKSHAFKGQGKVYRTASLGHRSSTSPATSTEPGSLSTST
jgi:hypothetical protein